MTLDTGLKYKKDLINDFKDSILFLSNGKKLPEFVIDSTLPVSEVPF